jgi:hypothetical protein
MRNVRAFPVERTVKMCLSVPAPSYVTANKRPHNTVGAAETTAERQNDGLLYTVRVQRRERHIGTIFKEM